MRRFIAITFILLSFFSVAVSPVFSDSDYHHEEENEVFEEIGEIIGWGSIALGCAAFALFPIKKSAKTLIKITPHQHKKSIGTLLRSFSKVHLPVGWAALILGFLHGVFMYLDEGLEFEAVIGIVSLSFLLLGAIFGLVLWKKRHPLTRKIHLVVVIISAVTVLIHVVSS